MSAQLGAGLFPLPSLCLPSPPSSGSRRCWQRYNRAVAVTKIAILIINSLNIMYTSFATSEHPATSSTSIFSTYHYYYNSASIHEAHQFPPSAKQSRLLAHIYTCASRFVRRRGSLVGSECGDLYHHPLAFFDEKHEILAELRRLSTVDPITDYLRLPSTQTAKPVVAERVSLPDSAGSVDLLSVLPPDLAAKYADPARVLAPGSSQPSAAAARPRGRLFGSRSEWTKLVRRLRSLGMIDFTVDPAAVCGVFCTDKAEDRLRFIIDARNANKHFCEPERVELPTPDVMANLVTDPSRPLYVAKVDLDNFYHRIKIPIWMRRYFSLPPVRAGDLGLEDRFGGANVMVHPCCTTLPMGWSHSVLLAQRAHEHMLTTEAGLLPADRISRLTDPRVDRLRHQVYVDDLSLLGYDPVALRATQDRYIAVAERKGFVVKQAKVIRPSCDGVDVVGLEVNGREHTVGLSAEKLERLCQYTRGLLAAGECTGLDLAHIVGRWTWASLACRPALSAFSAVYRFIRCAGSRAYSLWPTVRSELEMVMGLAPLLYTSTSAAWVDRVVATDASEIGMGVVAAAAPRAWVSAAGVQGSAYVGPSGCAALAAGSADDLRRFTSEASWRTIVSSKWRHQEHINVLELRAVLTAVRWVLSLPQSVNKRLLVLCDSMVAHGSVSKGRSSSQPLLRRLRALAAMVMASGLRVTVRWIPTDLNPADEPSRRS